MEVQRALIQSAKARGRSCKGSFTIEAALVVPLCILIIASIIVLGFRAHAKVSQRAKLVWKEVEQSDPAESRQKLLLYKAICDGAEIIADDIFTE